jgi:hypothetical protein
MGYPGEGPSPSAAGGVQTRKVTLKEQIHQEELRILTINGNN